MAETSGPWDGSDFSEDEWRELFSYSRMDGIIRPDGEYPDGLIPSFSSSNREITFTPGWARIRGNLYHSDADIVIDVPVPSGSNQRIDYVVLRYDPSEVVLNDRIKMVLVEGQEASNPTPPTLTQEHDGVWEHPRIRIGPFGSGAITGAPRQIMGTALQPTTYVGSANPNDRIPGLPTIHDSLGVSDKGKIWRYRANLSQYELLGEPQYGSIAVPSGWQAYPQHGPRYRVDNRGLVTLRGLIRRTGSTIQFGETATTSILITGNMAAAIRPADSSGLFFSCLAYVRVGSSTGAARYAPVRVSFDGNPHSNSRLETISATFNNDTFLRQNESWISLAGISWWLDDPGIPPVFPQ